MRFNAVAAAAALLACSASAQQAPLDPARAVYELRTYYPAPGKAAALNARFRQHTLKLFARHGMTNVAYWAEQAPATAGEPRAVYVLAYPSREARERSWEQFGRDPEWRAVVAASEADGKLVTRVDSIFMTMTDYSPRFLLPGTGAR